MVMGCKVISDLKLLLVRFLFGSFVSLGSTSHFNSFPY